MHISFYTSILMNCNYFDSNIYARSVYMVHMVHITHIVHMLHMVHIIHIVHIMYITHIVLFVYIVKYHIGWILPTLFINKYLNIIKKCGKKKSPLLQIVGSWFPTSCSESWTKGFEIKVIFSFRIFLQRNYHKAHKGNWA